MGDFLVTGISLYRMGQKAYGRENFDFGIRIANLEVLLFQNVVPYQPLRSHHRLVKFLIMG